MDVVKLLSNKRILCGAHVSSKKRALELVSQLMADSQQAANKNEIFDSLVARERLGTTGLGHGVALPHGRLPSVQDAMGVLLTLAQGIDFDANDREPVDLVFALVVPQGATEEHLQLLAQMAELLRDPTVREKLRLAASPEELQALIQQWQPRSAA